MYEVKNENDTSDRAERATACKEVLGQSMALAQGHHIVTL